MTHGHGTVAVIGGNGQLGSDLATAFTRAGFNAVPLTHQDIRVDDEASVKAALEPLRPVAVLNTAAFHVVPKCEELPDDAWRVNALGALNVARESSRLGATCVYYSTDYVFDGAKGRPYVETDRPRPLNVYGVTKLAGEEFTLTYADRPVVIRVSGIYGTVPCRAKGSNFVSTMIKAAKEKPEVRVVTDETLTPTSTVAIAEGTVGLLAAEGRGTFHMTCEGQCSWYEFARAIFDILEIKTPLLPASVKDFPSPVKRPHYSVLENEALKKIGVAALPEWRKALDWFLGTGL